MSLPAIPNDRKKKKAADNKRFSLHGVFFYSNKISRWNTADVIPEEMCSIKLF